MSYLYKIHLITSNHTPVMDHPINQLEFSDNSSDYEHPNIDRSTLKRLVREKKQKEREAKIRELEKINKKLDGFHDPELLKRKMSLEENLKPKLVETSSQTFENKPDGKDPNEIFTEKLLFLGSDPTLENFIEFVMNNKNIDLQQFYDFLLLNLAENIREGYDEAGLVISKLTLFFKYLTQGGVHLLQKLNNSLADETKKYQFEIECKQYYEDSKNAILNCPNQEQ